MFFAWTLFGRRLSGSQAEGRGPAIYESPNLATRFLEPTPQPAGHFMNARKLNPSDS
jgi:hypothetical protein